jgi:hypothetical protein
VATLNVHCTASRDTGPEVLERTASPPPAGLLLMHPEEHAVRLQQRHVLVVPEEPLGELEALDEQPHLRPSHELVPPLAGSLADAGELPAEVDVQVIVDGVVDAADDHLRREAETEQQHVVAF